jgi:hypothetical protein
MSFMRLSTPLSIASCSAGAPAVSWEEQEQAVSKILISEQHVATRTFSSGDCSRVGAMKTMACTVEASGMGRSLRERGRGRSFKHDNTAQHSTAQHSTAQHAHREGTCEETRDA